MTPEKDKEQTEAEAKAAAQQAPAKPPAKSEATTTTGWYHDAGHSATQEREAAQRARDEAFGVGVPVQEPED
jgi:hypothetical protein